MEHITSRKNRIIADFRRLASDPIYRLDKGEFVCDGEKLLKEALGSGAVITAALWGGEPSFALDGAVEQYICPPDLMQYASPLKNSRGPVFSVKMRELSDDCAARCAIVLENVQDPGNVGTVLRTADAFGVDLVVLTGDCADVYNPKTVRSSMGAVFRQRIMTAGVTEIRALVDRAGLPLYGAALSDSAADIRSTDVSSAAVAIGSEGRGLSEELLSVCDGLIVIPMRPCSESLNAAVAASVVMWEMVRDKKREER